MTIDLVISYYKEDLGWLDKYKGFNNIYIYNKGPNEIPDIGRPFIGIKLPNIGRCDHTYLYHIIHQYNNLGDVTIFTTGSVDLAHKTEKFDYIFNKTMKTRDSVFYGSYYNNVGNDLADFQLTRYKTTHPKNDDGSKTMALSKIRPFGKWYDSHFSDVDINIVNYLGIFSVSKKHILQHDVPYYQKLIDDFPDHSNPEVGHYFERAWVAVFHPIPEYCLNYHFEYFTFINLLILIFVCLLIYALFRFEAVRKGWRLLLRSFKSFVSAS